MEITKNGTTVNAKVEGKLDRTSSPDFEAEVVKIMTDDVRTIIIDLEKAIYISSAGLRVILSLEKKMRKVGGKLIIKNVPPLIMDVFTETGLSEILTME